MSGGVDSSVAAFLLKELGYDVIGVTMRLWSTERQDLPPLSRRCCSVEDVEDARQVCQTIGVPHYVQNFEREFQAHVVDYFCREYDRGRTPHPCLACNDKIKFDFLLRRAMFLDADYVATGHYARIRSNGGGFELLKGVDGGKDQSYVLFTLGQPELRRLLLPVGEYPKEEIRRKAVDAGLAVADKPDSQDICFIPDGDYRKFVGERVKPRPGEMVDTDGGSLGSHPGIQFFTVGTAERARTERQHRQPDVRRPDRAGHEQGGPRAGGSAVPRLVLGLTGQLRVGGTAVGAGRGEGEDPVQGERGAGVADAEGRMGRDQVSGAPAGAHTRTGGGLLPRRRGHRRRHHRAGTALSELTTGGVQGGEAPLPGV